MNLGSPLGTAAIGRHIPFYILLVDARNFPCYRYGNSSGGRSGLASELCTPSPTHQSPNNAWSERLPEVTFQSSRLIMPMPNLLFSLHDRDAHPSVPAGGWVVESIALSENPQPQDWSHIRGDINWILRLNWAHNGTDGTIPLRGQYDEFAKRCTDYLMTTRGAYVVIIANEPNHAQEYPNGTPITPEEYADCFNRCYASITNERPDIEVLCAAVAPWDVTSGIDWLAYYKRMLTAVTDCDGLAVHGYTHGADPNLIWSIEKQHGWYWHFPVIYQTIQAIPARFADRPVHVTETDQGDNAWADINSGWVQNAYQSVDEHNRSPGTQKIVSLALYRWRGDKYEIYNKGGVMDDFNRAVSHGYLSPGTQPEPTPPRPTPKPPEPTRPGGSRPDAVWDPRLTARGCTVTPATVAEGGKVYRLTVGKWFDEEQAGGRVNIFMRVLDEAGNLAVGVPLTQFWSSGEDTKPSEVKSDPFLEASGLGAQYSGDFGMTNVAPSYGVVIDGANPSDKINGCGLGSIEQPNYKIHTAYFFEWQLSTEGTTPPLPPTPTDIETGYVTARAGLNVRSGPSAEFEVLGTLAYGSTVLWDGSVHDWMHVVDGWVSGEYVDAGEALGPASIRAVPGTASGGALVHPLPNAVITQNFYENAAYYDLYGLPGHDGVDLAGVAQGTPIASMAAGIVSRIDYDDGYGNFVMLAHDQLGAYTVYCHASEILVVIGASVSAGEAVALVGSTGNSSAPHLHLEVREMNADGSYRDGAPMPRGRVDPRTWCFLHGLTL